jgi:hypothetical protein
LTSCHCYQLTCTTEAAAAATLLFLPRSSKAGNTDLPGIGANPPHPLFLYGWIPKQKQDITATASWNISNWRRKMTREIHFTTTFWDFLELRRVFKGKKWIKGHDKNKQNREETPTSDKNVSYFAINELTCKIPSQYPLLKQKVKKTQYFLLTSTTTEAPFHS